jgi:hypothetical protein
MAGHVGRGPPLILAVAFIGDDYASSCWSTARERQTREIPLKEMADGARGHALLDDFDLRDGTCVATHVAGMHNN